MSSGRPMVVTVGGSALDIKGRATAALLPATSNPGRVDVSPGGVGRNIAENLALLGVESVLISAFSLDLFGEAVVRQTRRSGVNLDHAIYVEEGRTSLFMALMNSRGDLHTAVADMDLMEHLTADLLKSHAEVLRNADFIVLDADLPLETLHYIVDLSTEYEVPVCIEPVSVARAQAVIGFMDRVAMVTPNREEAEVLVGFALDSVKGITNAGAELMARGVRWPMVTLGPEGVYIASEEGDRFFPSISTIITDSVGAGDALVAGTVFGLVSGQSFVEATRLGIAAATLTLTAREAVCPTLSRDELLATAARIL